MKKLICVILIICLFPIPVKAESNYTQELYKELRKDTTTGIVWTVAAFYCIHKINMATKGEITAAKIKAGKAKNIAKYKKEKKLKEQEMKMIEEKILELIEKSKIPTQ